MPHPWDGDGDLSSDVELVPGVPSDIDVQSASPTPSSMRVAGLEPDMRSDAEEQSSLCGAAGIGGASAP